MQNETSQLIVSGSGSSSDDRSSAHTSTENECLPSFFVLLRDGVILDNTGSTARDQLANERTYLAWTRTSLSLIGAGLALLKWDGTVLGYLLVATGILLLVTSTRRYFRVMHLLQEGRFEPNVSGIVFVMTVTVAAIVAAFFVQF
jgi:putative membrane protein